MTDVMLDRLTWNALVCSPAQNNCRNRLAMEDAAFLIKNQAAEIERLREAIERQASAIRTLHANEQTEINTLRKKRHEWHHAVSSLDSEREANALLTAEIERLTQALVDVTHYADRPGVDIARKAIAAGAHKPESG